MSKRRNRIREEFLDPNMLDEVSNNSNELPSGQEIIPPQISEMDEAMVRPRIISNNDSKFNYTSILPTFEGSENQCPEFFFNQFEEIANLAQWTQPHKTILLKNRLRGEARQTLQNNVAMQSEPSYEKLKNMILDHFVKTKSLLQRQAEFQSIKQTPGMTPRQLALKISSAAKVFLKYQNTEDPQSKTLIENTLLGRFCEALRPDIRIELRKYAPSSFNEAIERATILDEALTEKSLLIGNQTVTRTPPNKSVRIFM